VEKVYSYGNPSFVWCYNPYAFESLFANQMSKRGAKIVLEFEDACLSRRKTSIKPYVDYSLWRWRFPRPAMGFAVNRELYKQLQTKCDDVHLLPGIVPDAFEVLASQNPPFRNASGVKIGYFGGLTTEKGADKVLQLHDMLPSDVQFGTTGGGPLQAAFEAKAKQHANFRYLGAVSQAEMIKEIFTCDVLLNPHKPLSEMNSGVFPFKVMEAIATERVVISTNIDEDEGMNKLLSSVRFVEHSVEAFANAIHSSRAYHEENRDKIKDCAQQVRNAFSESAIRSLLKTRLLDTENGSSS
jgi:glycosyltransferase involved in cell wall biosynthesis